MSALLTYRVSYRITHVYDIEVEASSADHAEVWARTLLDRTGGALSGSKPVTSDIRICDVRMAGLPCQFTRA
ncbi:MAG TPA: hypothetical protein VE986_04885 [Hyphomicrobiales bacterium]|nr:hypothetical protein [Hyphomicrobiales bacterium]